MLDHTTAPTYTTDALAGVEVIYIAEEAQARRLLTEMIAAAGRIAIDIETTPNKVEAERLADLLRAEAETAGLLKARKKVKAPALEIAALLAKRKQLGVEIGYARDAGLDPRRARIRSLQTYAGGDRVLVIDLDKTGSGILTLLDGVNVIAHNIAFELSFIEAAGVALGELQCTLQVVRLRLGTHATSLAAAAAAYLNLKTDKTLQTSDWGAPHLTREQIDYAAIDAVVAWRIAEKTLLRFDIQRSAYEIQVGAIPTAMRPRTLGTCWNEKRERRITSSRRKTNIPTARFLCQTGPVLNRQRRQANNPANRATGPKSRSKRNLPAEERRRELLDAAVDIFSEKGMGITIQALADRVSVTQPLVHRYFRTRADLIAGIREKIQFAHWDPAWRELLTDRSRPLCERIPDFYTRYLPHIYSARWYRSFWYAALSDPTFAQEFLARVHEELLLSIIGEARSTFGYPALECRPAGPREIELVWGMHSTTVFLGIRRYVYHTPVSPDLQTTVLDQMRAYLHTVPEVMEELMPSARRRTVIER